MYKCDECGARHWEVRETLREWRAAFRLWLRGEPRVDIPPTMGRAALVALLSRAQTPTEIMRERDTMAWWVEASKLYGGIFSAAERERK